MNDNSQTKTTNFDPWNALVRQTAVVAVPLDQVLDSLRVPRPEVGAVKDELMAHVTRIIAESDTTGA